MIIASIILVALLMFVVVVNAQGSGAPLSPGTERNAWQRKYSEEQARFDRMRALFERQRDIEDHSPAGRNLEQRAIDAEFRELCPIQFSRRREP